MFFFLVFLCLCHLDRVTFSNKYCSYKHFYFIRFFSFLSFNKIVVKREERKFNRRINNINYYIEINLMQIMVISTNSIFCEFFYFIPNFWLSCFNFENAMAVTRFVNQTGILMMSRFMYRKENQVKFRLLEWKLNRIIWLFCNQKPEFNESSVHEWSRFGNIWLFYIFFN